MKPEVKVGIIGSAKERHCLYLSKEIESQGGVPVLLDNAPVLDFPLSLRIGRQGFEAEAQRQSLADLSVCYMRALFLPSPVLDTEAINEQIEQDGYTAYAAERERYATWLSWLQCLPLQDKLLVNPVDTLLLHFAKPYQLEMLRRAGVSIPETLVTGHADRVLEFAGSRELVYKPVAGGALCRKLEEEDKQPDRLATLANAPVLFQEYVPGKDIRVFVLDGEVISAFEVCGEGIDYREGPTEVKPVTLNKEVESMCIHACQALGLVFSGVDLKQRSDGTIVLIECNPSPMFEGFDRAAPFPIVSRLAAFLIDQAAKSAKSAIV